MNNNLYEEIDTNIYEEEQINVDKNYVLIPTLSAVLILIFHNLKINWYIKDVIIPFIILLISNIYLLQKQKYKNKKAYFILVPITLILINGIIFNIDGSNILLNFIALPILYVIFFFTLINKNYFINLESLKLVFKVVFSKFFLNLEILDNKSKNSNKKINSIISGIFIGGCISIVILMLLMSADNYFEAFIDSIFKIFDFNYENIILLIISFFTIFNISVNFIRNVNLKTKENTYKKVDNIMIITILSIINSIFVLFLISEISKLTFNFLQLPVEYTYANYAREGFFQLLFITVINYAVIAYLLYRTKCVEENKIIKKLILTLIAFSIILIFNSYYRMFLYINAYSFTILRLQVILFLAMELIIFIVLIKKILKGLINKDSIIFFTIITFFYIINLYTCNKIFIDFINNLI